MDAFEEIDKNILYLDDEIENLESFSLIFMEYFNIFTTQNADEALEILQVNDIHVFITDQRMPGITGLEFLKKIRPIYPNIVCMIVSGYADTEVVIKALNETGIYQYIAKPWKMEEFKMAIDNAFEKYELRLNNRKLIQDLKESNKKLEDSNRQLANKVDQLDIYIYRASHDIKGYLTRFIGLCLTGEIEFKSHDGQVKKYFKLMHKEAQNMSRTLQNHLLLNAIETGDAKLQKANLTQVVENVLMNLSRQENLNAKEFIKVEHKVPENLQPTTDLFLIETILFQLLHNAIIFKNDYCEIVLSIEERNNALILTISDNGIGIEEEIRDKIDEQFFRGTSHSTGNGLGLYIVRLALEKLYGTKKLESEIGKGSKFVIQLPNSFQ